MATQKNIVNRALAKLGSNRIFISDYTSDTGPIAEVVRLVYDSTLEQLVRMHSWQCCKKRNELAPYKLQVEVPGTFTVSGEDHQIIMAAQEDASNTSPELYQNYPKWENGTAGQDDYVSIRRYVGGGNNYDQTYWEIQLTVTDAAGTYRTIAATKTTLSFDPSGTYTLSTSWASNQTIVVSKITPDFNWSCQHFIPGDAVRSYSVSSDRNPNGYGRYEVDWVRQGDAILSNYTNAFLTYEGIPTINQMDALFENAFVTLLACKLAVPITGSRELEISLLDEFNNVAMVEARRINGFEQKPHIVIDSEWLQATYESSGIYGNSLPPFNQSSYGTF